MREVETVQPLAPLPTFSRKVNYTRTSDKLPLISEEAGLCGLLRWARRVADDIAQTGQLANSD